MENMIWNGKSFNDDILDALNKLISSGNKFFVSLTTANGIIVARIKKMASKSIVVENIYQFVLIDGWKKRDKYDWDNYEQKTFKIHFRYSDLSAEIVKRELDFSDEGRNSQYIGCMFRDDFPFKTEVSSIVDIS